MKIKKEGKIINLTESDLDRISDLFINNFIDDDINFTAENGKIKLSDGSLWVLYAHVSMYGYVDITVKGINKDEITAIHPLFGTTIQKPMNEEVLKYIISQYKAGKKIIYFTDKAGDKYKLVKYK